MKNQQADWDSEERDTLKDVQSELDALRARHAGDPPFDLLRAARGDALPDDLQAAVNSHLSESVWSRALVEGADDVDVSLTPADERRLLGRIQRETGRPWSRAVWSRMWLPVLATAAVAMIVVVVVRQREQGGRSIEPAAPSASPAPAATSTPRVFQLTLEKPDVKLSPRALTYRGDADGRDFVAQLKPALDAYREGDYARAEREFSALVPKYPQAVEVFFYQGIARVFLNDFSGADASLAAADRVAGASFAADVAWYRAVVDERLGRVADARARLTALCKEDRSRPARCEAADRLR